VRDAWRSPRLSKLKRERNGDAKGRIGWKRQALTLYSDAQKDGENVVAHDKAYTAERRNNKGEEVNLGEGEVSCAKSIRQT